MYTCISASGHGPQSCRRRLFDGKGLKLLKMILDVGILRGMDVVREDIGFGENV